MAFQRRYSGEFLSIDGVTWRCDILQQASSAYTVGELTFPADTPLSIEWDTVPKEGVICGSVATLRIESPGDRTYLDLYSVEPGQIRLDVYRANVLYWSGCLDPEFYEEPYSRMARYDVTLTFSDFGILRRLKYNLTGMKTIQAVLTDALTRSCINYTSVDQSLISTYVSSSRATLDKLSVQSGNWTDESGDPSDLYTVIEGLMQPLAMKMVQKAGKIWVYDINGLYSSGTSESISWSSTDQVLGTDKVANNVRVTFSPYGDSAMSKALEYEGHYSENMVWLGTETLQPIEYYSFYPDYENTYDLYNISFTIFHDTAGSLPYVADKYFKILPLLGGEECNGIRNWITVGHDSLASGNTVRKPSSAFSTHAELFRTERYYLPALSSDEAANCLVRVKLPLLLDTRYNPFEEAGMGNERGNYASMEGTWPMIPVHINLYNEAGTAIYHYENSNVTPEGSVASLSATLGSWESGASSFGDCMFQYYDPTDISKSGLGGWKTNHQTVGSLFTAVMPSFQKIDDGQYMPYPPAGGWLEVKVLADVYAAAWIVPWTSLPAADLAAFKAKLRWCLYQAPAIELVSSSAAHSSIDTDDIEYSGVLNSAALDGIEINTVCGTLPMGKVIPSAKGLYYNTSSAVVSSMTRASRTDHPEQLLIGTLYSQYADRKTTLSGTCDIITEGLRYLTDPALADTRLMLLGEVQSVRECESQIKAAEFRPDEYTSA